ncbi:MAG: hypothetical protein ABI743_03555 [bacterium]
MVQSPRAFTSATHYLSFFLLLVLAIQNVVWLVCGIFAVLFPYGLDFGEGVLANQARLLGLGRTIYGPIDQPPWLVSNYPPVMMALAALLHRLVPPLTELAAGRVLAMLGTIGIVAVLVRLARLNRHSPWWALMPPWLWLVAVPAFRWGQVFRVDTLGIAFALWGLFCLTFAKPRWRILGMALLIAAVFTKQSLMAAPLAWLICHDGSPEAKRERALFVAAGLLVFGGLEFATGGGLLRHTVFYTANTFHIARLMAGLSEYLAMVLPLLLLVGWQLARLREPMWRHLRGRTWLVYGMLSSLTLITFGATGSDSNYYLEPLAALLAIIAICPAGLLEPDPDVSLGPLTLSSNALGGLLVAAFMGISIWGQSGTYMAVPNDQWTAETRDQQLMEQLRQVPGPVLSEDFSFTLAAGKEPDFQPYIFRLLAEKGKWDETRFVQRLTDGYYDRIVLHANLFQPGNSEEPGSDPLGAGYDRLTPAMEDAIRAHYALVPPESQWFDGQWYLYAPKEHPTR